MNRKKFHLLTDPVLVDGLPKTKMDLEAISAYIAVLNDQKNTVPMSRVVEELNKILCVIKVDLRGNEAEITYHRKGTALGIGSIINRPIPNHKK